MYDEVYGTLLYSLSWDGVGQIPARAELLVEQYAGDDTWNPIPISLMNESVTAGAAQGTISLVQRETGLVKQSGSLSLPPGEYRLTTTVAMDNPYPPVSRMDIAHIFSNLTTPAVFHYGSGDLIVTNTGTDTGSGFINSFTFSQTPGAASIIGSPGPDGTRLIMVMVPSGTDSTRLTPRVECVPGARITSPAPSIGPDGNPSWSSGDYSKPTSWTATRLNGVTQQYTVVVTGQVEGGQGDQEAKPALGIFDFVITNVPRAKVLIGTKTRPDGKIPIVVTVPYKTSPLTPDGSMTDLTRLIPRITLAGTNSTLSVYNNGTYNNGTSTLTTQDGIYYDPNGTIPFGNQNDYQEAVYRVTGPDKNTQDYVVIVARDVHHYYVKATGSDTDPDQYNGGSESLPFKTLAHAVYQGVAHGVDHIYVIGTLNDASEGGAYEDTSTTNMMSQGVFYPGGAPSVAGGGSVFNLNGTGRNGTAAYRIYITGVGSNAVLQGTAGKRVIAITGGAHITFDNITIQGGDGTNGGGMYIGGSASTVIWKSGVISGNTAVSGGGVYVEDSEFDLLAGSVMNNTASGSVATWANFANNTISVASIQGGGGVYVSGEDSLFWLGEASISGNTTKGSGGGVLVNGSTLPDSPYDVPHNFLMSAGTIEKNIATGGVMPHGGGGVYVAKGVFQMIDGHITGNHSTRQGGGVFTWSRALFYMDGNASITNNKGTGSSKGICNRGITTMTGTARSDTVYVWNYAKGSWNNGSGDEFTLTQGARVTDVELAFADEPQDNRNYINLLSTDGLFTSGSNPITTIGLESHLTSTGFARDATIDGDWQGKYLIKNAGNTISANILKRFPLTNFIYGLYTISLSAYKLDATGKLVKR